ncbi:ATP-binding protein [Mucilaginibacter angelicae]|uniref:histidine kinase n=1 Tax=Mucilaginibacter angelicae TaxID=869718 RepID=A0ABV6KZ75_9SPHI
MNREIRNMESRAGVIPEHTIGGAYIGNWKIQLKSNKVSFCPRMRKILELSKGYDEKIEDLFELVKPGQLSGLIHEFKVACFNGTKFEKQVQIVTPYGTEKWILLTGVLYSRRWGTAEQMIGTIEDVTQKVNEECLSMAIVNHELRAPLTIIKLNTQFLINHLAHSINKQPVKLLNMVDQHINGMTKLIDEYLSPSTSNEGPAQLNFSLFDVNDLVDTVLGEMKILYPGHRFCKYPTADSILVRGDKYKITQVLVNYLTNAAKFSPPCSHININIDRNENDVEISVHDQGAGINEENGQLLFQKFYQCNQKSVRQKNSKGLGLYIVKSIIQKHGGTVKAENGKNGGAVFSFSLPLSQQSKFNTTGQEAVKLMA